ncbi:MAG: radical SAM protein [Thermoanaerobaculia bacterium]
MSLGLSTKFDILRESPYELASNAHAEPAIDAARGRTQRWLPSRYTVRATTEDGRLVLWNTFSGAMCIFSRKDKETVERLLVREGFEARDSGVVHYLSTKGYVVPQGADEYRRLRIRFGQQQFRTDTFQLILLSSEDCNFRCTYCYEDFARGTMKRWVRNGIKNLTLKRLPALTSLAVNWFGGEPLYGIEAIDDLAPFFHDLASENGLAFNSKMTTNGYLLSPEVAERLLSWRILHYQITLDGPAEFHNQSRPARDGSGTFDTILTNLVSLHQRQEDFTVDLRVNFNPQSYPHLGSFLDLVQSELSSDPRYKLRFRPVGRWGGDNDANLQVCGYRDGIELRKELTKEAQLRGLSVTDGLTELQRFGADVCYAARPYNFIIGATGKVMKCTVELDKNPRNVVGSLNEDGELKLDLDRFALWTEPAFESDQQCQKCVILPTCLGMSCPLERFETDKSPCTWTRANFKSEMRQVASQRDAGRKLALPVAETSASEADDSVRPIADLTGYSTTVPTGTRA